MPSDVAPSMRREQVPFIFGEGDAVSGILPSYPEHSIENLGYPQYPTFTSWASKVGFIDKYGSFTGLALCIMSICSFAALMLSFALSALLISCFKSTQIDRTLRGRTLAFRMPESEAESDEQQQPQITFTEQ